MNGQKKKLGRGKAFFLSSLLCAASLLGLQTPAMASDSGVRMLVPVGHTIGIKLFSEGVVVVGLAEVETTGGLSAPGAACGLQVGDVIEEANGSAVESSEQFAEILQCGGTVELGVSRDGADLTLAAEPALGPDGTYRLGAWIRDSMAGIGTVTFYDPETGAFGALGHGITDSDTGLLMPLADGSVMDAAVKAAKAANYVNAGTVEFLLAPDGNFYFIEMNTRLQVEHPITEEISDVDIVKWQIRIACQIPLDFTQEDIHLHGHSMECRINARSTGQVDFLHIPGGSRVHFDTALVQDCLIVPFYDSMIGKLIVYAKTREDAIRKMEAALCEMVIHGIHTNIEDQLRLVRNPRFQKGDYDTLILPELLAEGGTELE